MRRWGLAWRRFRYPALAVPVLALVAAVAWHATADARLRARLAGHSADAIWDDPDLRGDALGLGAQVYGARCAGCHGADLKGIPAAHAPDLTDDHWLYGGEDIDTFIMRASDVERTVLHGIRAADPQTRNWPEMPARGQGHSLDPDEIADVTEYVLKVSGQPYDAARIAGGKQTFFGEGGCYDCHTAQGWGDPAIGAADLTRPRTWLWGSDRAAITSTVRGGRQGIMPGFAGAIDPIDAKAVAVYVLSRAATRKYVTPVVR